MLCGQRAEISFVMHARERIGLRFKHEIAESSLEKPALVQQ